MAHDDLAVDEWNFSILRGLFAIDSTQLVGLLTPYFSIAAANRIALLLTTVYFPLDG